MPESPLGRGRKDEPVELADLPVLERATSARFSAAMVCESVATPNTRGGAAPA